MTRSATLERAWTRRLKRANFNAQEMQARKRASVEPKAGLRPSYQNEYLGATPLLMKPPPRRRLLRNVLQRNRGIKELIERLAQQCDHPIRCELNQRHAMPATVRLRPRGIPQARQRNYIGRKEIVRVILRLTPA